YWALLGVAWGLDSFLRQRNEERERAALALRASRLERDLVEANLSNLREQLHPHFLFNALHSVGGLIDEGRGELAASLLAELGELLRALLDREPEQLAPLGQELELAERYLEIEGARLGERLSVTFREEVDASRALVPSFLLLPLVENAVRYAIAPRPAGGVLEVDVRREGDALVIEVRDDGPGFPPEVLAGEPRGDGERRSIGLANTRSRLAALYGDAAALELTNRVEGGARVRVRLPYDDTRTPGGPPA
ncbi:MAG: histidine kinase, partial [Planctomycetes bacterium]|nr:histidine kinase [Planctomycetota bacterium]